MKKLLYLCLVLLLMCCVAACSAPSNDSDVDYSSEESYFEDYYSQSQDKPVDPSSIPSHYAEIPDEQLTYFILAKQGSGHDTVTTFDNYDDALLFFTRKTNEDESTFNDLGYTREYFSENGVAFICWIGNPGSIYTLEKEDWSDKRVITLGELRPYVAHETEGVLIPIRCPHMNGQSVSVVHHLKMYYFDK